MNEPGVGPAVSGMHWCEAAHMAGRMMDAAGDGINWATCDPIHGLDEHQFRATDEIVANGMIRLMRVNHYPHHSSAPLRDILQNTEDRYGLPIWVSETGWHDGLPAAHDRFPHVSGRPDWISGSPTSRAFFENVRPLDCEVSS